MENYVLGIKKFLTCFFRADFPEIGGSRGDRPIALRHDATGIHGKEP